MKLKPKKELYERLIQAEHQSTIHRAIFDAIPAKFKEQMDGEKNFRVKGISIDPIKEISVCASSTARCGCGTAMTPLPNVA